MDIKLFTQGAANVLKRDGVIDNTVKPLIKPLEDGVDKFVSSAPSGIVKSESFWARLINSPAKAIAGSYKYFKEGVNEAGKENIFRKIGKKITNILFKNSSAKAAILENSGKIPFIGSLIVVGSMLWGIGSTAHKFFTQDVQDASKEFGRTLVRTACAGLAAVGLTATGAGALFAGAGAAAGLALGNKISDALFGKNKSSVQNEQASEGNDKIENGEGLAPVYNPAEVIYKEGFPVSGGQFTDEKFDQMLNYANAVAHY